VAAHTGPRENKKREEIKERKGKGKNKDVGKSFGGRAYAIPAHLHKD
jgi:hypothetical protein